MKYLIKVENLLKEYNGNTIIKFIDNIAFETGKSYCILGPSGSGKSTLLNLISGLITPTAGNIMIDNVDITQLSLEELEKFRSQNIGYISQDFKLFDLWTVKDNLGVMGLINKPTNSVKDVLKWVGLSSKVKSKVNTLSGGEKQRVAIARALLNSPKIMLGDEPTGSLNYKLGREVMQLIVDLHKSAGNILIVVTHDDRMSDLFDEVVSFEKLIQES